MRTDVRSLSIPGQYRFIGHLNTPVLRIFIYGTRVGCICNHVNQVKKKLLPVSPWPRLCIDCSQTVVLCLQSVIINSKPFSLIGSFPGNLVHVYIYIYMYIFVITSDHIKIDAKSL